MGLDGKTAVITGGTSGIGLAIADAFRDRGANVVVFGRRAEALKAAEEQLGETALGIQGDVTNGDDLERLFATTSDRHGQVDVLVANAGGINFTPLGQTTEEDFDTASDLNFKAVFFTVQAALPHLADGASVVAIGNALASSAVVGPSVSIAAKAAVRSLARTFAAELAPRGIRVNVLSPGPTTADPGQIPEDMSAQITRQIPLGRWGSPDDLANAAVFLASDDSSYITGADLQVGGGIGMGWIPQTPA
ncbi:MAG: SDR family NAD(P)-dependent oxidoreductase [Acidimicrobiales bacterium]